MDRNSFQKKSKHLLTGSPITGTGTIIVVEVDAVLSEGQEYSSDISSYPIEHGFNISDHIRREPETLSITGFVTDHPINILGITDGPSLLSGTSRSWVQYENLLRLAGYKVINDNTVQSSIDQDFTLDDKTFIIKVISSYRIYTNMFLQHLRIDTDPKTGDSLVFSATLKKVYFSTSQRTYATVKDIPAAPSTTTQAASKSYSGEQGTVQLKSQAAIIKDAAEARFAK